jgi:hypothetical protein
MVFQDLDSKPMTKQIAEHHRKVAEHYEHAARYNKEAAKGHAEEHGSM